MHDDPGGGGNEATRESILEAAAAEFGAAGEHGFRVEQVAARAGVSLGLMYYYFGNRQGLMRAALLRAVDSASLDDAAAPPGFSGALSLPAARIVGAEGRGATALIYEDAIRAAVFVPQLRPSVTRMITDGERDIAAHASGHADPRFPAAILSLADGLQQRVRSGILTREDALELLANGGRLLGWEPAA